MTSSPPARRFDWSNLGIRAVSAVVLIPAVVAAVWLGGWPFVIMLTLAVALLAREWGFMTSPKSPYLLMVIIGLAVMFGVVVAQFGHYRLAWLAAVLGAIAAGMAARGAVERRADAAYGVVYLAPAFIALVWLRAMGHGIGWTLMVFIVAWSADIFAFLAGNAFKGPKLWPRISPNKTWSGFFGGLAAAVVAGILVNIVSRLGMTWPLAALAGFAGGLATMAGDLWESFLKRRFGVKDSGDLIPGHGGLLDRVDGLLFAVVAVAAIRLIVHYGWAF
ncbi:phosphatidate cytidylyltransferase [Caulobacter sp. 73W]|uniref:Phosphatidate cytidylyltransferase n=1 Tax=Caulobacter sp. 73W TaxID=3161137 RepID=A0AB39KU91_9CAUL